MKTKLIILLSVLASAMVFGQKTDTLTFYSQAFNETRTVYVKTPQFYKYRSDSVNLPVIFLLDGQHDWFTEPVLSDIKYLQYTHEIPGAIVVIIPHKNRINECGIDNIKNDLPLDKFITQELDEKLKPYNPNGFKIIIGHSFSASFALFSYMNNPGYYSAVIAHTPLDRLEDMIRYIEGNNAINKSNIYISTGGMERDKDDHHRKEYERLKSSYPSFFASINTFEADNSAHNAVPIVSTPFMLTEIFKNFSLRYSGIAMVNLEYKLLSPPLSVDEEKNKILSASMTGNYFYPPEIPDINGIASRYSYSGYNDHALMVYELGIAYYPDYYEFYLAIYDILLSVDPQKAKWYLEKGETLLKTTEPPSEEINALLQEIENEKIRNNPE